MTGGPFATNFYIVGCTETNDAAIIDAGYEGAKLVEGARELGLTVTKLLQTHAHIDHVAGLHEAKALTGAPIFLHPDEQVIYDATPLQARMYNLEVDPLPPVDEQLHDGQILEIGALRVQVVLLPGHSPGSVAFWFQEQGVMFSGDVLFAGSIGRVDLPGSDPAAMKRSLRRLTSDFPDDTDILSGHGPATTLAMEKKRNPFLLQDW